MPTYLDLKDEVANNLGKTDGSTYNVKRESAINRARRRYYSAKRWTFLSKKATSVVIASQLGDLPTDYNTKFAPGCVYTYSGNIKTEYRQVEWDQLAAYGQLDYVYAVDLVNRDIKISQTNVAAVLLDYQYLPVSKTATDGSQDADVEPAPDVTAIALLATAYFYLSARQGKAAYKAFSEDYKLQLGIDVADDNQAAPVRFFHEGLRPINTGYQGGN
jgi:hypothetical protein